MARLDRDERDQIKADANRSKAAATYRRREDLRWVLSDTRGRRALQDIVRHAYAEVEVGNNAVTHHALGVQAVAKRLRTEIKALIPDALHLMEQEYDRDPELPGGAGA